MIPASHELCLFTVKSIAQFAKILKQCDKCYCFILNFTQCAAYSGDKVAKVSQHSEKMLDKLEKEYPVFSEPMYSIWEHWQPFQIPLTDTSR